MSGELGEDMIRADPATHADDFHKVVEAARCPVLVRGGGREDIESVFAKARALLDQGALGMVYGRNIYQHPNPSRVVDALMAMIHNDASTEQAMNIYVGDK